MKRAYIIAEVGVNHNGSINMAKTLIDASYEAGADAVKFQTFIAEHGISKNADKAAYQKKLTDNSESQLEMVKKLELTKEDHEELISYCLDKGIEFISTPFDLKSVVLLDRLNVPKLKISSGDATNAPLLLQAARTKRPIILSTGMCTIGEVEMALAILAFGFLDDKNEKPTQIDFEKAYNSIEGQQVLKEKVTLLHCTTEYPTPLDEVNLNAIETLKATFGLSIGFSDHTSGITIPIAAVVKGATIIEKHITLDRSLPGPDHQASLEPSEFKQMIMGIRDVEIALGSRIKKCTPAEAKNKIIARKSLVANKKISKGDLFTLENLTIKRPGTGISPLHFWDYIGKASEKDYNEDDII